jgi:hypothetical protein
MAWRTTLVRVPIAVVAVDAPAPVGVPPQHQDNALAHGGGQVAHAGVGRDHQVEAFDDGGGVGHVGDPGAGIDNIQRRDVGQHGGRLAVVQGYPVGALDLGQERGQRSRQGLADGLGLAASSDRFRAASSSGATPAASSSASDLAQVSWRSLMVQSGWRSRTISLTPFQASVSPSLSECSESRRSRLPLAKRVRRFTKVPRWFAPERLSADPPVRKRVPALGRALRE